MACTTASGRLRLSQNQVAIRLCHQEDGCVGRVEPYILQGGMDGVSAQIGISPKLQPAQMVGVRSSTCCSCCPDVRLLFGEA